jgi:cell volume regulation protein A
MDSVSLFLLTIAGIFVVGTIGELIFRRTGIPDVVWLIAVGILLGPATGVVPRAMLETIAPFFAALTLVVVLFEGGTQLKLGEIQQAAPRAAALAFATFLLSAAAMTVVSMGAASVGLLPEGWSWWHGMLLGSILGGSSSVIVMPTMARGNVDGPTSNLIGLESAMTDVLCVVGASTLVGVLAGPDGSGVGPGAWTSLAKSFGLGLSVGLAGGALWFLVLRALGGSEHAYPLTLAALMVLYVVLNGLGGSAALGVLAFAVLVGNASSVASLFRIPRDVGLRRNVRGFHSQVVFMVKSFFFTFIGLMLSPPWSLIFVGVVLGAVLFAARIPGVMLALWRSPLPRTSRHLAVFALPRGMAAGVLATLPHYAGVPATETLPVIVFATVFTTILIFTVGFGVLRRDQVADPAGRSVQAEVALEASKAEGSTRAAG